MSAKPITPLILTGDEYLLAAQESGRYALYRPEPADDFGVVAHRLVNIDTSGGVIDAMTQQLGTYIEKCAALEAALQKAGG